MSTSRIDLESINTLVPRAKNGDLDAQAKIFEQIYDVVSQMARKNFGPDLNRRQNPSDVVQLTMTRMISGFENFRGQSEDEFFGWLNAILKNEIRALRRNQKLKKRDIGREITNERESIGDAVAGIDLHRTPSSEAMAKEKIEMLQSALAALSEDSATVIRLRNLEELSFNEIADRMGRTSNAVAKLWQRAVVQLEKQLGEQD